MNVSEEEWTIMWRFHWKCTSSQEWREFNWKNLIRYFITPSQKSHYDGTPPICWRNCGNQHANHFHIFWDCPIIADYWKGIHNALQDIFKDVLPLEIKTMYFGNLPMAWLKKDKYLLNILLVAAPQVGGLISG